MFSPTRRDPWFLKGRTSVLQRAVLTSVVLGGLGLLAGLAEAIILLNLPPVPFPANVFFLGLTDSFSLALIVAVSYLRWSERLAELIATRVFHLMFWTAVLSSVTAVLLMRTAEVVSYADLPWILSPFAHVLQFTVIWLAWCVAMIRPSWNWLFLSILSACSLLALPLTVYGIEVVMNHGNPQLPPQFQPLFLVACEATFASQFLALLLVPWGIPFWFPPPREPAPVDAANG